MTTLPTCEEAARAILAAQRSRRLHGADRPALSVPVELGFRLRRHGLRHLRRGPRLSRAGAPDRRAVGRRHDPAHRLPRAERHLFSRPRRVGHAAPHPDLGHHPAAGLRHGPAPCARGCCRQRLGRCDGAHEGACSRPLCARIAGGCRRAIRKGSASSRSFTLGRAAATTRPAWDEALARVPTTTTTTIRRKDTGHVDASMRPRDEDYQRFIHLVDTYRDCGWDPKRQWAAAPFKIADVQMTAILARVDRRSHASRRKPRHRGRKERALAHARQTARGSHAPLAAGTLPLRHPRPDFRPGHRHADPGRLHPARGAHAR